MPFEAEWRGVGSGRTLLTSGDGEKAVVSHSMLPQHPPSSPQQDAGAPPEPNTLPTEAADNIEMPLPSNPQTFFLR